MLVSVLGQASFSAFLGAADDLLRIIVHSVGQVAGLDGAEVGHLLSKVAEIK